MTRILAASALAALCAAATAQPPAAPSDAKAKDLFKAGKFDDALKELQTLAKADPKLPPARITIADWFFQAGQGQPARLNLEDLVLAYLSRGAAVTAGLAQAYSSEGSR